MFPGPGSVSALCGAGAEHTSLPAIDPGARLLLTARSLPHSATGFRVGCHRGDVALLSLWVTNGADLWNTSASPLNWHKVTADLLSLKSIRTIHLDVRNCICLEFLTEIARTVTIHSAVVSVELLESFLTDFTISFSSFSSMQCRNLKLIQQLKLQLTATGVDSGRIIQFILLPVVILNSRLYETKRAVHEEESNVGATHISFPSLQAPPAASPCLTPSRPGPSSRCDGWLIYRVANIQHRSRAQCPRDLYCAIIRMQSKHFMISASRTVSTPSKIFIIQ